MKKIVKYAAPVLILPLLFASCLKDTEWIGPNADGNVANIIEFGNLTEPSSPRTSSIPKYALDMVGGAPTALKIKCVGAEPAREDIQVTIAVDNTLINEYNTENSETLVPYPTSQYTISTMDAVIKKGEREVTIPIDLKPDQFVYNADYALGLRIASASSGTISGNFGKVVLGLLGRNPYDGVYDYEASAATALQPEKKGVGNLVTTSPNTVRLLASNGAGLLLTYINEVTYTVDPATNQVTVNMTTLLPIATDPSSHYDPATKTFHLKWTSNGGARMFEETLTYTGSRD